MYPGADGEFTLYEDENDNYNYEKGAYSTILFKWNEKSQTLTISERKGAFTGMLPMRNFNIIVLNSHNNMIKKSVSYKGKKSTNVFR